jgi:Zn-dependent peptidase ImmA (M78 family)
MIDPEAIAQQAEYLASEYSTNQGGGDPATAIQEEGIKFKERGFGASNFEGASRYRREKNRFEVFINTDIETTAERRQFTRSHELAHVQLAPHRDLLKQVVTHRSSPEFNENTEIEREADLFGGHFLAPTKRVKKIAGSGYWTAETILDVASQLECSRLCAAIRCQQALRGVSALIKWNLDGTAQWQKMENTWWEQLPSRSIRHQQALVRGSATEMLLNGTDPGQQGYIERGNTMGFLFPRHHFKFGIGNDQLVREYAIPLGIYGVLTLVRPDSA